MVAIHYSFYGLFCSVILILIYLQAKLQPVKNEKNHAYNVLLLTTISFCIIDAFWGFVASGYILNKGWLVFATTLFYLGASFTAYEFLIFIILYCEYKLELKKINSLLAAIPFLLLCVMLVINWNTGILFYTGPNGEYCRGIKKYVYLMYMIHLCYYISALVISICIIIKARKEFRKISRATILFSVFPIITGIYQFLYPELPFYSVGFMLSCFSVFIFQVIADRDFYSKELLRHQQKDILDACATVMYGNSNPKKNIDLFLGLLGNYYQADRTYYCQLDEADFSIIENHEWLASGVKSGLEDLKSYSNEDIQNWIKKLESENSFVKTDNSLLDDNSSELYEHQLKMKIKNILVVPIIVEKNIIGFVGVDNSKEYKGDLTIIRTISFFIYSELQRQKFIEEETVASGAVIQALTDEYSSIFHIDVDTDRIISYRLSERMTELLKRFSDNKAFYKEVYPFFVDNVVVKEDQEEMYEFGEKENLKLIIRNLPAVTKRFKCSLSGKEEFYESKWSKILNKDGTVKSIVWGLANINDKIVEQQKENEQRLADKTRLENAIEHAEEISRESQIDKLTGLYNKLSGLTIIQKYLNAKDKDASYALFFIDLDNFKTINDNFGHLEGDQILSGVGKAITSKCRIGDIAVRFGGDEFIILVKDISTVTVASSKAKLISSEIQRLSLGKEYSSTCSIGGFISSSSELERILDMADKALYEVKKNGRDGVKILTDGDNF
ncbi:MAG: diguanylate cyclase [Treponema sp.]|nr:diguanylate cyclase [Candidatus Treponema merdequi]